MHVIAMPLVAHDWDASALWTLAHVALAAALLVLPIALAVRYTATSDGWWERGFERYDAVSRTGLTPEEVDRVAAETREYLSNDEPVLEVTVNGESFYSEREILHMVDVKRLMSRVYDAGWASLGFIVAFLVFIAWRAERAIRGIARSLLFACGLVAIAFVVLAVFGLSGFDSAFRQFHLIFFTNDLWQLTSRDALIQLFPQRFFFDTTLLIGGAVLIPLAAISGVSWYALRRFG